MSPRRSWTLRPSPRDIFTTRKSVARVVKLRSPRWKHGGRHRDVRLGRRGQERVECWAGCGDVPRAGSRTGGGKRVPTAGASPRSCSGTRGASGNSYRSAAQTA